MPNTVTIHNSVSAATIDAHLCDAQGNNSNTQKAGAGHEIAWDLLKLGWKSGQHIDVSVHAETGKTRHASFQYESEGQDFRFKAQGTTQSFQVNGPL